MRALFPGQVLSATSGKLKKHPSGASMLLRGVKVSLGLRSKSSFLMVSSSTNNSGWRQVLQAASGCNMGSFFVSGDQQLPDAQPLKALTTVGMPWIL